MMHAVEDGIFPLNLYMSLTLIKFLDASWSDDGIDRIK
jgi:hypothetical protein